MIGCCSCRHRENTHLQHVQCKHRTHTQIVPLWLEAIPEPLLSRLCSLSGAGRRGSSNNGASVQNGLELQKRGLAHAYIPMITVRQCSESFKARHWMCSLRYASQLAVSTESACRRACVARHLPTMRCNSICGMMHNDDVDAGRSVLLFILCGVAAPVMGSSRGQAELS